MSLRTFRSGVNNRLASLGYVRKSGMMRRDSLNMSSYFSVSRGFRQIYYINVGIVFSDLGYIDVNYVQDCHVYFRLDRLLGELSDIIRCAEDQEDESSGLCYKALLDDVLPVAVEYLDNFADEGWLRSNQSTLISAGMIKREFRTKFFNKE